MIIYPSGRGFDTLELLAPEFKDFRIMQLGNAIQDWLDMGIGTSESHNGELGLAIGMHEMDMLCSGVQYPAGAVEGARRDCTGMTLVMDHSPYIGNAKALINWAWNLHNGRPVGGTRPGVFERRLEEDMEAVMDGLNPCLVSIIWDAVLKRVRRNVVLSKDSRMRIAGLADGKRQDPA